MGRVIEAFKQFFDGEGDPLVKGWLRFLESGSNNTLKNTYSDPVYNIVNANPIQLDAEGRCPNIFGTGDYRVISYTNDLDVFEVEQPGEILQVFDPVTAQGTSSSGSGTAFFTTWSNTVTYGLDEIVSHSGNYYRSLIVDNLNNNPAVSPESWEQIDFVRWWNENVSYSSGEMVFYDDACWFSLQDSNINQQPDLAPTYWNRGPFMGGYGLGSALEPLTTSYFTDLIVTNDVAADGEVTAGSNIIAGGGISLNDDLDMQNDSYINLGQTGGNRGRLAYISAEQALRITGGNLGIQFTDGFAGIAWEIDFSGRFQPGVDLAENIGQATRRVGAIYTSSLYANFIKTLGTGAAGYLSIGLHENEVDEDQFLITSFNDNAGAGPFQLQIFYNGSPYTLQSV